MLNHPTRSKLQQLKLTGMLTALDEQNMEDDLTFHERLGLLVDREMLERQNKRLSTRLKQARLQGACMADIDYRDSRQLDKSLLRSLQTPHWIKDSMNVLVTGACGAGKSFMGRALGHQACLMGYRALCLRLPRLFEELSLSKADGSLLKLYRSINRIDVLILDDFGLNTLNDEQRRFLLEILEDRHNQTSTIVTSQLPVDTWHQTIGQATLADAILDRLVHNAYTIPIKGDSMRKIRARERKSGLRK